MDRVEERRRESKREKKGEGQQGRERNGDAENKKGHKRVRAKVKKGRKKK
jgi:hypothetical protein